jgi:hypothetical protein
LTKDAQIEAFKSVIALIKIVCFTKNPTTRFVLSAVEFVQETVGTASNKGDPGKGTGCERGISLTRSKIIWSERPCNAVAQNVSL